ncbi:MAG: hypothetical protein IH802_10780 [Nitrospinae bacterium]|nr:hypothetical protein [Nitrospinota bacterium]
MKERNKKELAEFLWLEINRAILNSNNVRNCLKILQQMDMLDFLSQHDYILDGKKLVEKILDQPRRLDAPAENTENFESHHDNAMEMILEGEQAIHYLNQEVDLTKGVFTKQLIRVYGFCRN